MDTFSDYLKSIDNMDHRDKMAEILSWIKETFPELNERIAWNQPMFTNEGTFIIGFSYSKNHIAVSPEVKTMQKFKHTIEETGLIHTENIVRIPWEAPIPYELLESFITFNIEDKQGYTTFWRQ